VAARLDGEVLAMSKRHQPEQAIQRALVQHLHLRAAVGVYWFHPANGGSRRPIEAAILKACGVRAGTPDLICIKGGRTYALELKAEGGRVTDAQRLAHKELRAAGAEVAVASGIGEALSVLERWELLR
jgi:hypothetical protein